MQRCAFLLPNDTVVMWLMQKRANMQRTSRVTGWLGPFYDAFYKNEKGEAHVSIWVTGNETGFREIYTADTPATEVLHTHTLCNFSTFANCLRSNMQTILILLWYDYAVGCGITLKINTCFWAVCHKYLCLLMLLLLLIFTSDFPSHQKAV